MTTREDMQSLSRVLADVQITKEEAILKSKTEWWKEMLDLEVAKYQAGQKLLCMPFSEFHRVVESALGRPVWVHEFASPSIYNEVMNL